MTRQFIAGGLYGDHLPSGVWCVVIPNRHCVTHLGIVPFPLGEAFGPLFLRCTDVGGFRFAGQAHDSLNPAAFERVGTFWSALPPPCVGVSPLIYDLHGVLHCSDGSVGSQGYRYVNEQNELVSGDATYGPFHGLFEYTPLDDNLWIGQGAEDGSGIRVWDGSTLRQLEKGDCRFLRANRVDDVVALAFTRPEGVVLITTTMVELRGLPSVTSHEPPPPPPTEDKEPPVSYVPQAPDLTAMLRALTVEFPTEWAEAYEYPGHERTDRFVRIAAKRAHAIDPRFGLNGKRGTDTLSLDVLAYKNPTVPESCGGVELRDFIFDDRFPTHPDGPKHDIVWSDATIVPGMRPDLPDGVRGKWIAPGSVTDKPPIEKPPVSGGGTSPTFDQAKAALVELNRFYKEEDGLARGKDQFYDLGILDWFALVMSGTSVEHVKASIRTFDEYKRKHP